MALITTPLATDVIGCGIRVHRALGPGLFESVHEACLADELSKAKIEFRRQVSVPIKYGGREIGPAFRLGFLIENELILELKSIEKFLPVHDKQLLTYLKLTGLRKGLLMNFNASLLKHGIRSVVR